MCLSKANSSILYVGSRTSGVVNAVVGGKSYLIKSGLRMPNGVAWRDGSLFVAESHRITRFDSIDKKFQEGPLTGVIVLDNLPTANNDWHAWKHITFGPDGMLYIPFGAPCNYCQKKAGPGDPPTDIANFASIARCTVNGTGLTYFARGIRNTVGMDFHPVTKQLWFTENGRDNWGANRPEDELNVVTKDNLHFGFPFCYGYGTNNTSGGADPIYYSGKCDSSSQYTPAAMELGPHVAAVGMRFYTGSMFPAKFKNAIIYCAHGSWNRPSGQATGYTVNVVYMSPDGLTALSRETLAWGWLKSDLQNKWGRPVDIEILPDGSILVSDDQNNAVYRITYGA